jgi:glycosyltransferase involved in cell wall biosynthesis
MKNISIIGITGLPACYGGFETLADNLVKFSPDNISYTVFCSKKVYAKENRRKTYKNAKLKYLSVSANGVTSILYDFIGMLKSMKSDDMLILGVSGCIFLPFIHVFYRGKIITNIDGLEWKRNKWNKIAKIFLHYSEKLAIKYSDVLIGDNKAIIDYVNNIYHKKAVLIEYGADQVNKVIDESLFDSYPMCKGKYAITVCRVEPENNIHLILEAFRYIKDYKLIIIGNWKKSKYGLNLFNKYSFNENIFLLDSIYDLHIINWIRSNASIYIHGHSAGGTNPSLVEAMNLGLPIFSFDCIYNRETTENKCIYWSSVQQLEYFINHITDDQINQNSKEMRKIAIRRYKWEIISGKYTAFFE